MRYCYGCGHTTPREPLFCNSCGRSYDLKLCPKLHINPRLAEACSQCGSRDLSTPQPRVPPYWHLLAFLVQFVSGILLAPLTLPVLLDLLKHLLSHSKMRYSQVIVVLFFTSLWSLWTMLPGWLRKAIYRSIKRRTELRKSG
jgi:hypothetical protein